MFMFIIRCLPDPKKSEYAELKYCLAHIWVKSDDQAKAETMARDYATSYGWLPQCIERAFDFRSQQPQNLHQLEAVLYLKAVRFGIAADFLASPKVPRETLDVEVRKLSRPEN